jgi:hypothetical protein
MVKTPQRLDDVFVMRKGERYPTCSLWTHDFGCECRLLTGGELIATQVCGSESEIEAFNATLRKALAEKGWS